MKAYMLGAMTALILFGILGGSLATYYAYENITLNNSRIINLPTTSSDVSVVTKSYVDSAMYGFNCTSYSVATNYCNSNECYATQATADYVCSQKRSGSFAGTYYYYEDGAADADSYDGKSPWRNVLIDAEDIASGGGSYYLISGAATDTGYITDVLCCK